MHFLTVVVLPQEVPLEENAIYAALERLLGPYDSELEGPTRKEYWDARRIRNVATRYGVRPANLPKIAAKLHKEFGGDWSVDDGGLFFFTNLNPDGKYDYWSFRSIEEDVWFVRDMPRDLLPFAVVTPDGQWHDTGEEQWDRDLTASERQAIGQRAYALIDQHPDCGAVALDCHI